MTPVEDVVEAVDILVSFGRVHRCEYLLERLGNILASSLLEQVSDVAIEENVGRLILTSGHCVNVVRDIINSIVPNGQVPEMDD